MAYSKGGKIQVKSSNQVKLLESFDCKSIILATPHLTSLYANNFNLKLISYFESNNLLF